MFEWDENKNQINIEKHHIDFNDAKEIWQNEVLTKRSPQTEHGEDRNIALGILDTKHIAVVYTNREDKKRLISARRARKNEETAYKQHIGIEKKQLTIKP